MLAINATEDAPSRDRLIEPFADLDHSLVDVDGPVLDLEAFRRATTTGDHAYLGAYARPRAANWLAKLAAPLSETVGLTGACGSFESLRDTLPPLERLTWRRSFPAFPNPHIRTHAFALSSETLAAIEWPEIDGKKSAWGFENGRRSLYRRVLETGRRAVVVGADGSVWEEAKWPESQTFYSGEQENLLIGDLRTQAFIEAGEDERARLAKLSWG